MNATLVRFVASLLPCWRLGVNYGGSLHMWREYLGPQGHYIGVDISNYCKRLEADGFVDRDR